MTSELPVWDLSDLYSDPESPEIFEDRDRANELADRLSEKYRGKVTRLNSEHLVEAIGLYEEIEEILGKLSSYSYLLFAEDMSSPERTKFYQDINEACNDISSKVLFFILEINQISDAKLDQMLQQESLSYYKPWIRDIRVFRNYQLSDELEQLLHEKSVSGRQSWIRLFDETMANLRFPYDQQQLTATEIMNKLSSADADERQKAAKSLGNTLGDHIKLFSLMTNVLAKDKAIEDRWRKYDHPMEYRNISNYIEDEVVYALITTVKNNYNNLSHRYYAWKAKELGYKDAMPYWDRNAPFNETEKAIPYEEAVDLILTAYDDFSPLIRQLGEKFFNHSWIHARPKDGKDSGAFAHPTVPSVHPYLLVNYNGKARDIMTLAHELGHGVHQLLAAEQGVLMSDTPLTLAETASVFGEQLTFRALLKQEQNADKRKFVLANKVEDMLNTVVRQIAFCDYEQQVHKARQKGELSVDQLCDIWLQVQSESLGSAVRFDYEYRFYWSYIPHFIHSPFYVYAYAFGDCLVNALYACYQEGMPDFEEKYVAMLSAGGTKRHKELLEPFGLDATQPDFWQKGLNVIDDMITELHSS